MINEAINRILTYEIVYLFTLIFSIMFLVYIVVNVKNNKIRSFYIAIHILILIVLFSNMIILISPTIIILNIFVLIKYLTLSIYCIVFIAFCVFYVYNKKVNLFYLLLLSILPIATLIVILTNPSHGLFYSELSLTALKPNILFYVNSIIYDVYIIIGLIIFVSKKGIKVTLKQKKVNFYFFILVSIILISKLYFYLLASEANYNVTLVIANISIIIFGYLIFISKFFNIEAYGIDKAINNLLESIVILNKEKKVIDVNRSFTNLMKKAYPNEIENAKDKMKSYQLLLNEKSLLPEKGDEDYKCIELENKDSIYLNIIESITYDKKNNITGYILIFRDISEYIFVKEKLESKNIELAKTRIKLENHINDIKTIDSLEKRNRLAKELHDILGHTLTVTNLKLHYCINEFEVNEDKTKTNIKEIKGIVEEGIKELSKSIGLEEIFETVSLLRLRQELVKLASNVRFNGINIEVTVKGIYKMIPMKHYNALYRICQEAITNAIRHSEAENVYIIIKESENEININIFDDGNGCEALIKGNGLSGMEQRIKELNGEINFRNINGEGFYIKASIGKMS